MNPVAANLDGHALAARYEVLRHDVVASADRHHTLHSLALLMRKGMAAWIKDVGGEELPVREDITPPASSAMCVPEDQVTSATVESPEPRYARNVLSELNLIRRLSRGVEQQ